MVLDAYGDEFVFEEVEAFMLRPFEERQFIIGGGLLPKCGKMFIFGLEGVGKTMIARQLALDLICGLPFLDLFEITEPVPTAMIQCEIEEGLFYRRMKPLIDYYRTYSQWNNRQPLWICSDLAPAAINTPNGLKALIKSIKNLEPVPQVVILDPLGSLMAGDELSMNDAKTFTRSLDIASRILGASFVILHHQRKASVDRPYLGSQEMFGSIAFSRWADCIINIRERNSPRAYELRFTKMRHAAPPQPLAIELSHENLKWEVKGLLRGEKVGWARDRIIDLVFNAPGGFTVPSIIELMSLEGFTKRDVQKALESLISESVVAKQSDALFPVLREAEEERTRKPIEESEYHDIEFKSL